MGFQSPAVYWVIIVVLVVLNVVDNVMVVVLFDEFTEIYAQFVNQSTTLLYIVLSSIILGVRLLPCCRKLGCFWDQPKKINADLSRTSPAPCKRLPPFWSLFGIGMFNGSANFFMGAAEPHTPGLTQTLLTLLSIPFVLVFSAIFLKKRTSVTAIAGALAIICGASISALRVIFQPDDTSPIVVLWWSVALFAAAQIFLAGKYVWEEATFATFESVDPMKMYWCTLVTQFLLGWALYPAQALPGLGNITLSDVPDLIVNGTLCALGHPVPTSVSDSPCSTSNTLIFFLYCGIDFCCYFFGLYVIQRGSANLMVIASAIALPLQQLVLCTPFLMSKWVEAFFWGDAAALVLVLIGFGVYQFSKEGKVALKQPTKKPPSCNGTTSLTDPLVASTDLNDDSKADTDSTSSTTSH